MPTFSRRDTHLRATTDLLLGGSAPCFSEEATSGSGTTDTGACDPQHKCSGTIGGRVDLARKPSRLRVSSPTLHTRFKCIGRSRFRVRRRQVERDGGNHMYATVRRYEGIDKVRSEEVTRKVGDSLLPQLRELPGFGGYYLIDAGGGVLTSVGLFESSAQAHESTRLAAQWVREQRLADALPNTPKITAGPVIARELSSAAVTNGIAAFA